MRFDESEAGIGGQAQCAEPPPAWLLEADAELAGLCRSEAQLRLRAGELLDALAAMSGHHELGFSSLEAYVVERCQRSRAWGRDTRGLAKRMRVRGLCSIRGALLAGEISWSMAELVARHARGDTQDRLVDSAKRCTVREMRAQVLGDRPEALDEELELELPKVASLHRVTSIEVLMLRASRMLVGHLNGFPAGDETLMTALLGEAETTLQALGQATAIEAVHLPALDEASLEASLTALRAARRREALRGPKPRCALLPIRVEALADRPLPSTPHALDREIVACSADLARRNLRIGRLAERLLRTRAWDWLGFDSVDQYARERLGLSLSSLEHRVMLARRVSRVPALGEALERGAIGYEAALLLSRVLGRHPEREVVKAWIDRATRRTVKHLREEVVALLSVAELEPDVSRDPPDDEDLEAVHALEREVQRGDFLRSLLGLGKAGPQMSVGFLAEPSAYQPARLLKLRVSVELLRHWRAVEAEFRTRAGPRASFVSFACACLWLTWRPYLERWDDKWKEIFRRDRHVCTSPVCERRDVTLHHLEYRAHGGTDAPENLASGCAWCHLEGIHGGRLKAEPPASRMKWTIGRQPILVVEGREKKTPA